MTAYSACDRRIVATVPAPGALSSVRSRPVRAHEGPGDGEAEAGAAPAVGARTIASVEALEEVRQLLLRDPGSVVANAKDGVAPRALGDEDDLAAAGRVAEQEAIA